MDSLVILGLSLGLGLLIGLQRQRVTADIGGIRTFPMISLFGTFCGFLALQHGPWIIVAGLFGTLGMLLISNLLLSSKADHEPGQTTEAAALITFVLGVYVVDGDPGVAALAAGVVVILLHAKVPLHTFVQKMGQRDIAGIMQFVVITLIILPILPNRTYGPFAVLNPYDIWRMVVLIVTISLAGYIAYKIFGERAGTILGGILGGAISSTATTVSFARRTRQAPAAAPLAVVAILIASTVAYLRVLIEITAVAPAHFPALSPPIGAMLLFMILLALAAFLLGRPSGQPIPAQENPAELRSALTFGFIYALVVFLVAAVQHFLGPHALYAVAIVSGLTDMDAITLSVSGMVADHRLPPDQGWRLILVASLSNLLFKGGIAAVLGGWRFALRLWLFFALALALGLLILFAWPQNLLFHFPSGGPE